MKDSKFKSREALMRESLIEFGCCSYEEASLNRIIKRAEVSKGSFYYHFKNKEDLYQVLLRESIQAKWAFISEYTQKEDQDFQAMDIFDKFLYQTQAGIAFSEKEPRYNRLAIMFSKEKGNPIYERMIDLVGGSATDILKSMIHEAYDRGELDTSYPVEFTEHLMTYLFSNYDDMVRHSDMERNLEDLKYFINFLKNGLSASSVLDAHTKG